MQYSVSAHAAVPWERPLLPVRQYTVSLPGKNSHTRRFAELDVISRLPAWAASFLFILFSALVIPLAGIQDDEALFAVPFWQSLGRQFEVRVFHHGIPLMLISYLGTLKTALYWPLFRHLPVTAWTVRLPMVLAGGISVFFFFKLLRQSSPAAAILGSFFLATDPTFLLTNTFDWGPVALEHLLLITGCYALVRFSQKGRAADLALGFFLFGLALWNKALFLWALSGLMAAAIVVFAHALRKAASRRNLSTAVVAFLLGSLPFVLYNLRRHGATLGENVHLDLASVPVKWVQFENAANGNALFAFIAEEDYVEPAKPLNSVGHIPAWIQIHLGRTRKTGFLYVFSGALILVPLWWKSRAARFSLVFMAVAGGTMILTKDAGGAAHHIVLLWPFPVIFVATALAGLPWRWLVAVTGIAVVAMNILVLNQYLFQFERNGAAGNFTDALFPLSQRLQSYNDRDTYVIDWGIVNSVQLSNKGHLRLFFASDPLMTDTPTGTQQAQLLTMVSDPRAVFVGHVTSREAFVGVGARLERFAGEHGFRRRVVETIPDSNGRPVFEIARFEPF